MSTWKFHVSLLCKVCVPASATSLVRRDADSFSEANCHTRSDLASVFSFIIVFFMSNYETIMKKLSRYSESLRAGRSGDRILVGTRFSSPVQTGPGAQPPPLQCVPGLFPRRRAARS